MKLFFILFCLVLGNTIYANRIVFEPNSNEVLLNVGDTSKKKNAEKKQVKELETVITKDPNEILTDAWLEDSLEIFLEAEQAPAFRAGFDSLDDFLSKNLNYPVLAKENGIEGRVVARFVVEKDGSISKIELLKKLGWGCDEAAILLVNQMPKWIPGKMNGKPVRTYFTLPIVFKLK